MIKQSFRGFGHISAEVKNLALFSTVILIESMQAIALAMLIANAIPLHSSLAQFVFPEWLHLLKPEREMLLYRIFILTALALQAGGMWVFRRKLKDERFMRGLGAFAAVEAVILFLLLSAAFKMIIYDYHSDLARQAFYVLLGIAAANKIFWRQVREFGKEVYRFLTDEGNAAALTRIADVVFPLIIFAVIFVPFPNAVVARNFFGEQFHHNDSFIMGPGWAFLKGCILNYDIITQYGLGMPVFLSLPTKLMGGFSYEHVFLVLLWACIIYYLLAYWLLRKWVGHPVLALSAILLGIKWQMFHTGVYPIVYMYTSATVVRYYFDIFVLLLLFFHVLRYQKHLLLWAGALAGVGIFHISSDGLYMAIAFYAYLFVHLVIPRFRKKLFPSLKDWFVLPFYALVTPLTTFVLCYWFIGPKLFLPEFWHNMGEFIQYFLSGWGVTPMTESLGNRYFLANLMSYAMPLVYVLTLIVVGSLLYLKKIRDENLFVLILCIYGLGTFHYYVARSAVTSYYAVCIPYVFILCFWLSIWLRFLRQKTANAVVAGVLILCVYALFTNHTFIAYPNVFNFSRNPITDPLVDQPLVNNHRPYFNHLFVETDESQKLPVNSLGEKDERLVFDPEFNSDDALVNYYRKESDFREDADLIQRLTSSDAKVPLISSFEIKMLIQADRAPFFYYFPLIISRPMSMRLFPVTSLYTVNHLKKTIDQLESAKPEYIFMERIFLQRAVPQEYEYTNPGLMPLLNYVFEHYTPAEKGKFLVAMKKKD